MIKTIIYGMVFLLTLSNPVFAGQREIPKTILKNGISLNVAKGHGLVISFIESGETIHRAWLSDPSRIVFDTDGGLCSSQEASCDGNGSKILFLRVVDPIALDGLPSSPDKSTILTVIASKGSSQSVYQFKLSPGQSAISLINVVPGNEVRSDRQW